jgi:hypothetical protein
MLSAFFIAFALLPFALAQESSGIKAIEAHFTQSHLVPDLFASFNPSALLSLNYAGVGVVNPGQSLTIAQVAPIPTVTVTPANSSVTLDGTYTLAMVDADVVGSKLPDGQTRHWLVNGVTISGSTVANSSATTITGYAGPYPASGSGPHRYVVVIYAQPSTFAAPAAYAQPLPVGAFDFNAYVQESGLGPLVAATYIDVEEGTTTLSIPPTSAVVTSTLLPSSAAQTSSKSTTASAPSGTSGASSVNAKLFGFTATAASLVLAIALI